MKIDSKLLAIVLGAWMMVSCNSLLDLDPDGHINMEGVFSERSNVQGYLNACYNYRNGVPLDVSSLTDEAQDCQYITAGSRADYWYNVGLTADNYASQSYDGLPWSYFYEAIRKCNIFIANMPASTAYGTPDEKAGWLSQAYVLRAYYYLQLFKRYGQLPLLTEDAGAKADYSKAKKSSTGEIVRQILADCDAALSNTLDSEQGFSWEIYAQQKGIMTRGVAYAIKSEAITYAVSPLFDDGTYTWNDALEVTKEALYQCLTHDYSLYTTVSSEAQNAYDSYFLSTPYDRSSDKESIYAVDDRLAVWQNAGLPTNDGVTKAGPCPSQELVDAYEMANGQMAITGYKDADHLQPIINAESGYDEENPYEGRDPRFYATIYYNGALRYLDQPDGPRVQTYKEGNEGVDQTSINHTKTGYYVRKYNNYKSTKYANSDGFIRIFRLAELYLNFAEAAYQATGNTPDTKVNIGGNMNLSAVDAVNAIRARVGMPALPGGLTAAQFQVRYRNERRVEFAMEGHRFFDARRWKVLGDFKVITGMEITLKEDKPVYKRFRFNDRVTAGDKYLLYPVERDEVNKMFKLTGDNWQNPGW